MKASIRITRKEKNTESVKDHIKNHKIWKDPNYWMEYFNGKKEKELPC